MEGAFRRSLPAGFRLIETLGWRPGAGFGAAEAHLGRMARTAARLGAAWDRGAAERALAAAVAGAAGPMRCRLTLALGGEVEAVAAPLAPGPAVWTISFAAARYDPADRWLGVKTTERAAQDAARAALPSGVDEAIFLNSRGEVCEGTITNLFLLAGGALLTPPLGCGVLPGVLREGLLRRGLAREAVLWPEDLARGEVLVGNSLRGLIPARLAG